MSPDSLSRVACLRIPHFQIAVLERSGQIHKGASGALIRGPSGKARVAAHNVAAYRRGVRVGMMLSRAMMIATDLQVVSVDESPASQVTGHLYERLHRVAPRISSTEAGNFWLEPFSSIECGESHFVTQIFGLLREEGFEDARMGIADTVVASNAASRLVGPYEWRTVEAGGDASFLAQLSLDLLPIGQRVRSLLRGVGIRSIRELQGFSVDAIQRRLGRAGLRAWDLAWAKDPRGPRTPLSKTEFRVETNLLEPTRSVETIIFVLKGSVERLSISLRAQCRGATGLSLELIGDDGTHVCLDINLASATYDPAILFQLVRARLTTGDTFFRSNSDVESIVLTVVEAVPLTVKQADLWSSVSLAPHLRERVTADIESVLGEHSFVVPVLNDSQKPELRSHWMQRTYEEGGTSSVNTRRIPLGSLTACMKMLDSPKPLRVRGEGGLPSEIFVSELSEFGWIRIFQWNGPETLSGYWWLAPYERDYYWALSEDQCAFWVFFDRLVPGWFFHGWLD